MSDKIGIVTVLYNSETVLVDFFHSLELQSHYNFVLYVIDNKSPDNSLKLTKELAARSTFNTVIIANDENYGVAKGNNIGIEKALEDKCDYVLLSNNDVEFGANTILNLLQESESVNADLAVPKIYVAGTKLIWFADSKFNKRSGYNIHIGYLDPDIGQFDIKKQIELAPTCFILIRKEVFDTIGIMDENYFVYWDDTDFVYRAKKKGKSLWYVPTVTVNHKEGTSTGVKSDFTIYYLQRNFVYFTLKNRFFLYAFFLLSINLAIHLTKNIFTLRKKQWKIGLKGYTDGFRLFIKAKRSYN